VKELIVLTNTETEANTHTHTHTHTHIKYTHQFLSSHKNYDVHDT
jgi:hypothetical protein